jgi:hypothetical protein
LAAIGSASYSGAETGKLSDATGSDFYTGRWFGPRGLIAKIPAGGAQATTSHCKRGEGKPWHAPCIFPRHANA